MQSNGPGFFVCGCGVSVIHTCSKECYQMLNKVDLSRRPKMVLDNSEWLSLNMFFLERGVKRVFVSIPALGLIATFRFVIKPKACLHTFYTLATSQPDFASVAVVTEGLGTVDNNHRVTS